MPRCPQCSALTAVMDEICPKCGMAIPKPPPPAPLSDLEQQVLELMRQGQKIEAIKVYRAETNVGLKQAKDFVEALATQHGIPHSSGGCGKAAAVLLLIVVGSSAAALALW